ncbi:protein of unknown function [Thauera humireducens]|nr:protein of unknown function [Thauera humireducens]
MSLALFHATGRMSGKAGAGRRPESQETCRDASLNSSGRGVPDKRHGSDHFTCTLS